MFITTTGRIQDNFYLLGHPGYPMFLLDAPKTAIFDACVCFAGKIYVKEIRSVLGNREPSILFLTHVHWDHCGATSYLKDTFPSMKVAASGLAKDTLQRPSALALMKRLNEEARIEMLSLPGCDSSLFIDDPFRPFEVDIELQDNSVFDLGNGTTVEILATPGHTRDHHSFYMPKEKILVAGEAGGLLLGSGDVTVEFLSSFDAYLASLKRLAALPVEVFCQGHGLVVVGKDEINNFFKRSINETLYFKERVFELLNEESGSLDRVIQRIKAERYDPIPGMKQSEVPYLINLKAQIAHLAAMKAAM
ncbi:MAG: MBL fold metallo-hydrolase [Bacillota bacterium]